MIKNPAIYILASQRDGTLYVGVTSDLVKRICEHKQDFAESFTEEHHVHYWFTMNSTMTWKRQSGEKSN